MSSLQNLTKVSKTLVQVLQLYTELKNPVNQRSITFSVSDGENPITGATVTIGESSETTDSDGEATFSLDDYEQDVDTYTASISKTHYVTVTETFEATEDETIEVVLEKTLYSISCTVDDGTDPVQGAVITFTDSTDSDIVFTSGSSGSAGGCTVKAVAGTYVVTAECEGYDDYTHETNVTVSDDDTLSISLTEETQGDG